ncbi:hypothetical protein SO694_00022010 [Aureococcus anophagefferens]|uniref:RGS domain-containing protein n=1 Tax=Aureococcus anophagefferens TaxID=44056 RepID=A0ABR1FT22_AURAN
MSDPSTPPPRRKSLLEPLFDFFLGRRRSSARSQSQVFVEPDAAFPAPAPAAGERDDAAPPPVSAAAAPEAQAPRRVSLPDEEPRASRRSRSFDDDRNRRPSLKSLGSNSREMVQTLYDILDHGDDGGDFHAYLKSKHAEELVDFFRESCAASRGRDNCREIVTDAPGRFRAFASRDRKSSNEEKRVWAFRLYDTYLVDGAKRSVNLGENAAAIRFHIHKEFAAGNFAPAVLEPAVDSCLYLVAMGDLHKFARLQRTRYGEDDLEAGDDTRKLSLRNVTRANFMQALDAYG